MQREEFRKRLTRHHDYLVKLLGRMRSMDWRADDPMHGAAEQAREAVEKAIAALLEADYAIMPFLRSYQAQIVAHGLANAPGMRRGMMGMGLRRPYGRDSAPFSGLISGRRKVPGCRWHRTSNTQSPNVTRPWQRRCRRA